MIEPMNPVTMPSNCMDEKEESEIPPLPFLNIDFLKSPAARPIRILAEYLEPAERFRRAGIRDTIVFFGSARSPSPEEAEELLARIDAQIAKGAASAEMARTRARAETAVKLSR